MNTTKHQPLPLHLSNSLVQLPPYSQSLKTNKIESQHNTLINMSNYDDQSTGMYLEIRPVKSFSLI